MTSCSKSTASAPDDAHVGELIANRYRLLRPLGAGAMARVYVAEQVTMGRNVAVKLMREELELDEVAVQRFRREITAVADLRSPHTIQCHDAGESERRLFLAMELLAGETLRQRLDRERALPIAEVVQIAAQIGASLDEAHDAGVLHRDLKPENLFVCAHPSPLRPFIKVLDFGLAKLVEPRADASRLTDRGRTVGTPSYLAPESVVRGYRVDRRADIYALGVICFEMLTGQRPFRQGTAMEMVLAHLHDAIPRASQLAPTLPATIDAFFDRVLAKNPDHRPGRASDVAELLAAT